MSETLIITEEVKEAFVNVNPTGERLVDYRFYKKDWDVLFAFYNTNNEKRLSVNCRPCFSKVYYWVKAIISK